MIGPFEIRRKAERLYAEYQKAWLACEPFFPRTLPCNRKLAPSLAEAHAAVQLLQAGSKSALGYGYEIEWAERNSRKYGRNNFPERIVFETERDLLKLIGKEREFAAWSAAVAQIRARHPRLEQWLITERQQLAAVTQDLSGLLAVVDYFIAHPRPNQFARELPLAVDTKFIERHEKILRVWLDTLLPPSAIRADEDHFERRFGLKYDEPLIRIRFLDSTLQRAIGVPWTNCAVPLHELARQELPATEVLIVENKKNLLTLPPVSGGLGIGGLGNSVTDLRYLEWLAHKRLWYWGDIDVEGFAILSRLRTMFPHIRSILMEGDSVSRWKESLGGPGQKNPGAALANLTPTEQAAYTVCRASNLRIEQERIPPQAVEESLISECGLSLQADQ